MIIAVIHSIYDILQLALSRISAELVRVSAFGFFELALCGLTDSDAFKNKVLSFRF
jgi:hypothetical protein